MLVIIFVVVVLPLVPVIKIIDLNFPENLVSIEGKSFKVIYPGKVPPDPIFKTYRTLDIIFAIIEVIHIMIVHIIINKTVYINSVVVIIEILDMLVSNVIVVTACKNTNTLC